MGYKKSRDKNTFKIKKKKSLECRKKYRIIKKGLYCCLPLDGPAIVRINLFVRSIATISDIKMVSMTKKKKKPPCLEKNNIEKIKINWFK